MGGPYGIDPDEWAEAMRDAILTGGGDQDEANVEAELARLGMVSFNEDPPPLYHLVNLTELAGQVEGALDTVSDDLEQWKGPGSS